MRGTKSCPLQHEAEAEADQPRQDEVDLHRDQTHFCQWCCIHFHIPLMK